MAVTLVNILGQNTRTVYPQSRRENDQRRVRCSDLEFPLSQTSCLWICVRVADPCLERRAKRKGPKFDY
jgi:hypothetical protein